MRFGRGEQRDPATLVLETFPSGVLGSDEGRPSLGARVEFVGSGHRVCTLFYARFPTMCYFK